MEDNTTSTNLKHLPSQYDAQALAYNNINTEEEQNVIFIVQGRIGLEAIEDKIIILLDAFRSGYECKDCDGTGLQGRCKCHEGKDRFGQTCKKCSGNPESTINANCSTCRGVGSTIILPESAKQLPTSGRIVSCGPKCSTRKVGERVLFGAHTGYFLPFKGNARFRVMREHEPLNLIHAVDRDISLGDFLQVEENNEHYEK